MLSGGGEAKGRQNISQVPTMYQALSLLDTRNLTVSTTDPCLQEAYTLYFFKLKSCGQALFITVTQPISMNFPLAKLKLYTPIKLHHLSHPQGFGN